jgi:uncharacterized membrane protein YfcA
MVTAHLHPAPRLSGQEPAIAVVGTGVLGAAWVLPALWSRGVNPMPPCVFHLLTGQPCPFCGGTRSFVAMAHGDIGAAAHVYPLGPLLFVGLVLAVIAAVVSVVSGRRVGLSIDRRWHRPLLLLGIAVLAANWASKLFFLGY